MKELQDHDRKTWLAKAASTSSFTHKVSCNDLRRHFEEQPVPFFSRVCSTNRVAPTPSSLQTPPTILAQAISQASNQERRKSSGEFRVQHNLTFGQAFGALGIPLLAVVIICIVWTTWLIYVSAAPNEAANVLMNTGGYDNGNFWLIVEREPVIKWTSVFGLIVVDVCYLFVFFRIVRFRRTAAGVRKPKCCSDVLQVWSALSRCLSAVKSKLQPIYHFYTDLTDYNAVNRQLYVSFNKLRHCSC
ncbi:unnamed protein product [Phytophthora fragariaefolia]|uniref:Unnamed protein product n=1 Tax=Phytophthora fragariaefolia TaxID=1490495 RepID=A0A9W7CRR0_9STRA|nr:unnamed protein product [Phytophthora fragariaefolia]